MIGPVVGIGGIACILIFAELLREAKIIRKTEILRKFVHILTGSFAATWVFFMPFWTIQVISGVLLVAVLVSKRLSIFKSIHGVSRVTYGEVLFPVGIFAAATLTGSEWVYMAAILHMGLADGLAAAVGMWHARRLEYKILGQTKSLAGTGTFYILSFCTTGATLLLAPAVPQDLSLMVLLWMPIAATLIESVSVYGTDNLFVPLLVVAAMNGLYVAG